MALVIFGSETGNGEELAEQLESDINATVKAGEDVEESDIKDAEKIIIIVSTTGEGEYPGNFEDFHENLDNFDFKDKEFTVFGLGDTSYEENFVLAAREIEKELLKRGAKVFLEMGKGDDMADDGFEQAWEEWKPKLLKFF